jgi:thiamine-phosphate pyrophosphorylase
MSGLRAPVVCLVTDRARYRPGALLPAISAAAVAGIDLVQVRERDLPDRELLALARAVVAATAGTRARVVVNDRLDIALAAGAAGVHLRGDSVSCGDVRRIGPPAGFLVGRSVHTAAEAAALAGAGGCDYLVFGSILPSRSKPSGHPSAGFDALAEACRAVSRATPPGTRQVPVLAIGGLSEEDAAPVARTGAAGIAAIGLFASTRDPERTLQALRAAFDS